MSTSSDLWYHRGIVREATDYARTSIMWKAFSGFLLLIFTIGCSLLTGYIIVNGMHRGGGVVVFTIMAWLALITDEAPLYFISWLHDDPELVCA